MLDSLRNEMNNGTLKRLYLDDLKKECLMFREAIEKCSNELGIAFNFFPKGSCGDASVLFGTYLMKKQLGEFYYVNSEIGEIGQNGIPVYKSHAWIENDDKIIVDITADQFPEISEKVIISKNSEWHNKWKGVKKNIANMDAYDERTKTNMRKMYNRILMELER